MHAFNLETARVPAIALAAEVSAPIGSLAPAQAAFFAKAMVTKTTSVGRLHINVGGGTYAVRAPTAPSDTSCTNSAFIAFAIPRPGSSCSAGPPIIIDTPCSVAPPPATSGHYALAATRLCMAAAETLATPKPVTTGGHWFAGLGVDHAFALQSTLVTADVFAERFIGLYQKVDWTAEMGVRHQLTPVIVMDAGAGWHFAGTIRSLSIAIGATYEFATPPWLGT